MIKHEQLYAYYDVGTTNTRLFLTDCKNVIDYSIVKVGVKDSAIEGSNEKLLKKLYEALFMISKKNEIDISTIKDIWMSGMITNYFGMVELEHISVPVSVDKLLKDTYVYQEKSFFKREIRLVRGIKTAKKDEKITLSNIDSMNNARGEEIEVFGVMAKGYASDKEKFVVISPGSHTHFFYVKEGEIVDILSTFTGELHHAIKSSTILSGELSDKSDIVRPNDILKGYEFLLKYNFARALYIVHGCKVFGISDNDQRLQILTGIIVGSSLEALNQKISTQWSDATKIIILGGEKYLKSYEILCNHILPHIEVVECDNTGKNSCGLQGFFKLLNNLLINKEERKYERC